MKKFLNAFVFHNDHMKSKYTYIKYMVNYTTQPDSHYVRYTAASVLKSTTLSTPEENWLTCAW